ncbi:B-cell antigen receptor complex-associated protein beta chain [Sigmodon hispidus]
MTTLLPYSMPHHVLFLMVLFSGDPVPAMTSGGLSQDLQESSCSKINQYPRYIAKKRGSVVQLYCASEHPGVVTWFRQLENRESQELSEDGHLSMAQNGSVHTLTIQNIQYEDNGIYFCKQQCYRANSDAAALSCGSELKVLGFSTLDQLKRRNTLKDGIIMIQTLLIILFIIVPIFLLLDKDDSKAGTEEDHTYEGLNIDQTATYEDIVTLRTGEVKWSVGEHPGQE